MDRSCDDEQKVRKRVRDDELKVRWTGHVMMNRIHKYTTLS